MSEDIVDDLHAAEDRIGVLEQVLRPLLDFYKHAVERQSARHTIVLEVEGLAGAAISAEHLLSSPYERPSCDEDCDNEFCGSPRHVDQEWDDALGEWIDIDSIPQADDEEIPYPAWTEESPRGET